MIVCFDEFSLRQATTTHYAWAPRTERPAVPSDERRRRPATLTGMVAVTTHSGEMLVTCHDRGTSATVAVALVTVCLFLRARGYRTIQIVLDNCSTHHATMKRQFQRLLAWVTTTVCPVEPPTVRFLHTSPYSPVLNLAEYLIHHLRQACLYHAPPTLTLTQKADRIRQRLQQGPLQTPDQIQRTMRHIYQLVGL